ncbi:YqzE family protein [Bacillus sp. AFS041924]|uniref:YqzE family protein n=1 Tax=Bacillus sp. AFS041924 TaxID=2033503 RepID=UPI000BFD8686|nr:YqzE family protein [Bacillus sp. AFS041924]PGS48925.1 YqzE family protein [Bacillus sp. AFS041924]
MKTNDYVKYMTEQFINYIDRPKEKRDSIKQEKEELKAPLSTSMFGMLPLSIALYMKKISNRKEKEKEKKSI